MRLAHPMVAQALAPDHSRQADCINRKELSAAHSEVDHDSNNPLVISPLLLLCSEVSDPQMSPAMYYVHEHRSTRIELESSVVFVLRYQTLAWFRMSVN